MNDPFKPLYAKPVSQEERRARDAKEGARRVYWQWEQENYQPGQRWYPQSMTRGTDGGWYLATAVRR